MFTYEIIIGILSLMISFLSSASINDKAFQMVENYLFEYGYLKPDHLKVINGSNDEKFILALTMLQVFASMNATGQIDHNIIAMTYSARCGEPDYISIKRKNIIDIIGSNYVTYKVINYPNNLEDDVVDNEIEKAAKLWSDVTPLEFSQIKEGSANIEIRFEIIDGPGYNYGYCNGKGKIALVITLDIEESYTTDPRRGVHFFQVIAHELGHAIGLEHSAHPGTVMRPFIDRNLPNLHIHKDIKTAIKNLYYGQNDIEYEELSV